ncbi:hypothetical protein [Burkholderia anthina]|nr:hypothetical protein [Burkholderia anthina]
MTTLLETAIFIGIFESADGVIRFVLRRVHSAKFPALIDVRYPRSN